MYINTTNNYRDEDCNSGYYDDLSWGEWSAGFSYGTLYGEARCSSKSDDYHGWLWSDPRSDWTTTTNQLSTDGKYCWCRLISYTPVNGAQCVITPTPSTWVLAYFSFASYSKCAYDLGIVLDYFGL